MKSRYVFVCSVLVVSMAQGALAQGKKAAPAAAAPEATMSSSSSSGALRDYNVSVSPLGFLIGAANVEFDFGVSESIVIGPSISYSSLSTEVTVNSTTTKTTGSNLGFGLAAKFFLSGPRFTDSWFISPFVGYTTASSGGRSTSGLGVGADFGHWWFWENGFNIGAGVGIQYYSADFTEIGLTSVSGTIPSLRFSMGYSF